jgi:ABC-type enterochelin transport system permease subunit
MEVIKMHFDIVVTLIVAIFGSTGFWTWVQNRSKKKSAEAMLLLGIAYDKIIWQCNKFIEQGYISADDYDDLNKYLFIPYREMGGDGTAEKLMEEVKRLPTKKEVTS